MVSIGIDPGLTGAVVVMRSQRDILFYDTPTLQVKVNKILKNQMDPAACAAILEAYKSDDLLVTIEKVAAMPGGPDKRTMGATSAFNFGMGFGMWIGIVAALQMPYQLVHPATWKAKLMRDMARDKDAGRVKAMQLYPWVAKDLNLKKHHGRADALLLATYGAQNLPVKEDHNGKAEGEAYSLF